MLGYLCPVCLGVHSPLKEKIKLWLVVMFVSSLLCAVAVSGGK